MAVVGVGPVPGVPVPVWFRHVPGVPGGPGGPGTPACPTMVTLESPRAPLIPFSPFKPWIGGRIQFEERMEKAFPVR